MGTESGGLPPAAAGSGIGRFEWVPEQRELHWDATAARIFRADDPGEAPYDTWRRRLHPEDEARALETFGELDLTEDVYRIVLDDGSTRYILWRVTEVRAGDPETHPSAVGVLVDVTAAYETTGRIRDILESISDGFFSVDHRFRFRYLNPTAERVLDVTAADVVGKLVWEAFPETLGSNIETVYREVMAVREPRSFESFYPPLDAWFEITVQPASDGLAVLFQDVTERHARDEERESLLRAERRARLEAAHQAAHDQLTGLLNRREITERGQALLDAGVKVTALFLDLDRFKLVNDSLGHAAGDELLVVVARRLAASLRPQDLCARLGGDEFVVLLVGSEPRDAEAVAARILHEVRLPIRLGDRELATTISIGLAAEGDVVTLDTLLRDADIALYRAKGAGRDRFAWYDAEVHGEILEQVSLEGDLRRTLQDGAIDVHFQPFADLRTGRQVGVEALARWQHPSRGQVPPLVFVRVAEEAELISALGDAVLARAAEQALRWGTAADLRIWVNVSPHQLRVPGLADSILRRIDAAGVPRSRFGIEITESALADDHTARSELTTLSSAGLTVAIDDFGTGYSSLARLQDLPIDTLKIDQSFVRQIDTAEGRAATTAVIGLAHALGMTTIAEGIETPEQLAALRDLGSDFGGGYLLGRPVPGDELEPEARIELATSCPPGPGDGGGACHGVP